MFWLHFYKFGRSFPNKIYIKKFILNIIIRYNLTFFIVMHSMVV